MSSPTTASPAVHPAARERGRPRRTRRVVGIGAVTLLALVWFVFFRPPFLGGSTHYVTVSGTSMLPTLHPDDLVVLAKHDRYRVGDVIAYTVRDDPQVDGLRVIHRVIGGSEAEGYTTQGDNRTTPDPWKPRARDIMGRRIFVLPKAGIILRWLKTPLALALLALLWVVVLFWRPRSEDVADDDVADADAAAAAQDVADASAPRQPPVLAPRPASVARRPIRTPTRLERLLRRDVEHYEDVARALRRRYLLEVDPAGRRAVRAAAFDLAATYGDRDPRVDRGAFLAACGVLDEAAPVFGAPAADVAVVPARNGTAAAHVAADAAGQRPWDHAKG